MVNEVAVVEMTSHTRLIYQIEGFGWQVKPKELDNSITFLAVEDFFLICAAKFNFGSKISPRCLCSLTRFTSMPLKNKGG